LTASTIADSLGMALNSGNLIWALLLILLAGFLTALSPCVYPLIPITLSIMGARKYQSHWHGFLVSLSYVMGMVVLYTALGSIFASLGFLFGAIFQSPVIILLIAILFILLAFEMYGFYEIKLPSALADKLSHVGGKGYKGAFLMGLVAGVIAAPCTGPVAAFILTLIAQDGDIIWGTSLMAIYAFGIGIPFLFLGAFSASISKIPKSGNWMNIVKFIFGTAMLIAGLFYFQQAGSVLFYDSSEINNFHSNLDWKIINSRDQNALKKFEHILQTRQPNQKVMVDFYADWCAACKELEEKTFSDKNIENLLTNFLLIKIDATGDSPGLNKLQEKFKIVGLPVLLFYGRTGQELKKPRVTGFMDAKEFEKLLAKLP